VRRISRTTGVRVALAVERVAEKRAPHGGVLPALRNRRENAAVRSGLVPRHKAPGNRAVQRDGPYGQGADQ